MAPTIYNQQKHDFKFNIFEEGPLCILLIVIENVAAFLGIDYIMSFLSTFLVVNRCHMLQTIAL